MREKQRRDQRIVGSDTPPEVRHELKPHEGRISGLVSYKRDLGRNMHEREREKPKTRLNFVVAGTDASGELTIAPTLWARWNGWMKHEIIRNGFVSVYDAIHEAARVLKEATGYGSSVTTRRYLKEAVGDNKHGDYVKAWNAQQGNVITFSEKVKKRLGFD